MMYTDGGSYNNGERKGDGSYAFLFNEDTTNEYVDVYGEYLEGTTNNRTEMLAVIEGIKYRQAENILEIVSDSGYLVKGYTDNRYLDTWIANGWKTSTGTPVMNKDLWEELLSLSWHYRFNFTHIRGHMKDENKEHAYWNNIVDMACTYLMQEVKQTGLQVVLRYYFNEKRFEPISAQIIERRK